MYAKLSKDTPSCVVERLSRELSLVHTERCHFDGAHAEVSATANRKATLLPAGGWSNRLDFTLPLGGSKARNEPSGRAEAA